MMVTSNWLISFIAFVSLILVSLDTIANDNKTIIPSVNVVEKTLTLGSVVDKVLDNSIVEVDKHKSLVVESSSVSAPTLDRLIADYKKIILITNDISIREKIDYRLAQLLTMNSENKQEVGEQLRANEKGYYDESIDAYNRWLSQYPNSKLTSNVLYELAKAYELQGQSNLSFTKITKLIEQFPNHSNSDELNFRRGEYLFAKQQYALASKAYQLIIEPINNKSSPFYQTALYMAGWAQYKLDKPSQSLVYFSQLLDRNLPVEESNNLNVDELPTANKQLVIDAFKVMNLIFSADQGVVSLANFYQSIGGRYFEYLHYDSLAQEYLANKRYRDSVQTYDVFVANYPKHLFSPKYAIDKVEIFEQARFPTLANIEKEKYITNYGINGQYWLASGMKRRQEFEPTLRLYLSEIAKDKYRIAQKSNDKTQQIALFSQAATLLLQYQQTFNDNAELAFLYGESLYGSKQWREAINAYNHFAYGTTQTFKRERSQQANAAYAELLTLNALMPDNLMPKPIVNGQGKFVLSEYEQKALKFTQEFDDDKRAISILENIMNHRFSQARYVDTINIVDRLLTSPQMVDGPAIINAKLIKAHSIYNQAQYQLALVAYEGIIELLSKDDDRLTVINNNLAASLFNSAETLAANNQLEKAIDYYQQVLERTPNSPAAKLAHFNGAQYLYKLEKFDAAEEHLLAFKTKYGDDELATDIDAQLASIYEQQNDWHKAASQRLAIANNMEESLAQKQALYLTASFYEKAQDEANALKTYRRYANTYQQPDSRYFEAMNKITEKYLVTNKQRKYRFWLRKIIKTNNDLGDKTTERATYLAAKAALVFASDAKREFDKIKLTLPLRDSLTAKKKSLAQTLTAYKQVSDYHVASFTTQSTFETAQVYRQLANDLMDSQRPIGLDDLALEQYDILLEEQAFPFEDQAILLYENNAKLSWQGLFDEWIEKSFKRLSILLPGRYKKIEKIDEDVDVIY